MSSIRPTYSNYLRMKHSIWSFARVLLVVTLTSTLAACFHKEDFDFNMLAKEQDIKYDLALPLVSAELTIANLTGDLDLFHPDKDDLVHLIYTPAIPSYYSFGDLVDFPDMSFPKLTTPAIPYFKKDTIITLTYRDSIPFNLSNQIELDRLLLDSLDIDFKVNSKFAMKVIVGIKFFNILDSKGAVYEFRDTLNSIQAHNIRNSLRNYSIVLDKDIPGEPQPYLDIEVSTSLDLSTASNTESNPKEGDISVDVEFKNMKYKRVKGYFGNMALDFKDTVDVPALTNQKVNGFEFTEANLIIDINNGASMPIRFTTGKIKAFYENITPIEVNMLPPDYDVPYPAPTDQPMQKTTQVISDINNLIVNFPIAFGYTMEGITNPNKDEKIRNVIDKNSIMTVNMSIDVPLNFSVDDFIMQDTFPLSFSSLEKYIDKLEFFELKLILTNGFPIDAVITLAFLDADTDTLFTIAIDKNIPPGTSDPNTGRIVQPSHSFFTQMLHKEQLPLLRGARFIGIYAKMNTEDKKKVKIYQEAGKQGFLGVKIGTRMKIQAGELINAKK